MLRTVSAITLMSAFVGLGGCSVPVEDPKDICQSSELTQTELEQMRQRPDFQAILDHALANCPEVALQLVGPATASIVEFGGSGGDGSGSGAPAGGATGGGSTGGGSTGGGDTGGGSTGGGTDGGSTGGGTDGGSTGGGSTDDGNASANNGKGGNYDKTGGSDNGNGQGKGRR